MAPVIWLLEHHTNVTTKLVNVHILVEYVATVIANLARNFYNRNKVVHTVKGFKECGFTTARWSDQYDELLVLDIDVDVMDCSYLVVIYLF